MVLFPELGAGVGVGVGTGSGVGVIVCIGVDSVATLVVKTGA
jgi:hypothetical protein